VGPVKRGRREARQTGTDLGDTQELLLFDSCHGGDSGVAEKAVRWEADCAKAGDLPVVHAYVDGSVIELILGERIGYTKRFYYTELVAPDIVVVVDGIVTMEAWRVKAISEDQLSS
jgi:hypothetical protein